LPAQQAGNLQSFISGTFGHLVIPQSVTGGIHQKCDPPERTRYANDPLYKGLKARSAAFTVQHLGYHN